MLCTVLNKSWKQHSTKQHLYGHLPPISQTIQDEQFMWDTAIEGRTNSKVTFFNGPLHLDVPVLADQQEHKLCPDTWCNLEDLPGAVNDRDGWREKIRKIHAVSPTAWWWWWCIYIYWSSGQSVRQWPRRTGFKSQIASYQRIKNGTWFCLA